MDASEAALLLSIAAAYDNRTVSEATARAWAEAMPDISFEHGRAAIIDHYRHQRAWVMPADIVKHTRRAVSPWDRKYARGPQ